MDLYLPNQKSSNKIYIAVAVAAGSFVLYRNQYNNQDINKYFNYQQEQQEEQKQKNVNKPAGIYNEGNTCFVNSLLQALSSLSIFENYLKILSQNPNKNCNQKLVSQLYDVINKINSSQQSISVVQLLQLIQQTKQGLINLEQQDAHQLFSAITTAIQQVQNNNNKINLLSSIHSQNQEQLIQSPFLGYLKSSIICVKCKNQTSIKIDPFFNISLNISSMSVNSIVQALLQFQKQQRIEQWNCCKCSLNKHIQMLNLLQSNNSAQLKIKTQIMNYLNNIEQQSDIKQINIHINKLQQKLQQQCLSISFSQKKKIFSEMQTVKSTICKKTIIAKYPIITIHLKRLIINPYTGQPYLLKKYIEFTQFLNIKTKNSQKKYKLRSLLAHIGNQRMGHYFAFRRMQDKWFLISDSLSKTCDWSYVKKHSPYMLFYQLQE